MRFHIKTTVALLVLGAAGAGVYALGSHSQERERPHFRQAEVTRGDIVSVVNATGTVQPVLSVSVGSFVSGPIEELLVDFNQEVKKGDLLATIDPRIYKANVD